MSEYFKKLADISLKDSAVFGGKTASLGDMYSAGIRVPNGFGISIQLQKDYGTKSFDEVIINQLSELFKKLKLTRVAVRSSAIMEDGSDASWAGQLESFLNIEFDGLEKAILACWKSLDAEHIKDYARGKHVNEEDLFVGVTVQQMIDPEVAGVMFTANPVNQNKNEIMIEGLFGLGEMLVQGVVTPDRYIVKKSPLLVADFNIEVKSKRLIYDGKENIEEELPVEVGDKSVLREEQVLDLAKIGIKVEDHFKKPMDIEWTFKDGEFCIVQARPITTL